MVPRVQGYRILCLIADGEEDSFVRIPLKWGDCKTIEFLGQTYAKTSKRTHGGWPIFKRKP
jgi:hypothetical protein